VALACTVLTAGPITITQVKGEKEGYSAVQVGFGARKISRLSKAVAGHLKGKSFAAIREFRLPTGKAGMPDTSAHELGSDISVETFAPGDVVRVSGVTKGKGFQGTVKRHGFHGGRRTHGQKHSEREPGSIGGSGGRAGGRVAKGIRMSGRMGGDRVTVENLKVLSVDAKAGTLIVSGAVPGARGALLEITSMPAKHVNG